MKTLLFICAIALPLLALPDLSFAASSGKFRFENDQRRVGNKHQNDRYNDRRSDGKSHRRQKSSGIQVASSNCSAKANSLASSYSNAQILSVKKKGNSCIIVIKVKSKNGNPPRIIRKTTSG